MIKTELAYLAGVIDSDGTIGIKCNSYSMRVIKDCSQPTYSERICIKQVEPMAIDLGHRLFGGYRFTEDPSAKRGKSLHGWQVTDKQAVALIKAVLPFLRIKRRQAEICLELRKLKIQSAKRRAAKGRGHVGAGFRPVEIGQAMAALKAKIGGLNKVGV